jgi:glycosyltransferase involved in cell wall biosynthesis
MIDIIDYDDGLPISVIVPLSEKRKNFFDAFTFPMLEANMPKEIIVNDNIGSAPQKRNEGFLKATQPYVFFCDDDIILPATHLRLLYQALENNRNVKFAYSGYFGIVLHEKNHPIGKNFSIPTIDFDENRLKKHNYISTMTLMDRTVFPRFDETLDRLQDWDVWLTIVKNGHKGIAVHNNEFFAYYIDGGITSNTNDEKTAANKIIIKHSLGL